METGKNTVAELVNAYLDQVISDAGKNLGLTNDQRLLKSWDVELLASNYELDLSHDQLVIADFFVTTFLQARISEYKGECHGLEYIQISALEHADCTI